MVSVQACCGLAHTRQTLNNGLEALVQSNQNALQFASSILRLANKFMRGSTRRTKPIYDVHEILWRVRIHCRNVLQITDFLTERRIHSYFLTKRNDVSSACATFAHMRSRQAKSEAYYYGSCAICLFPYHNRISPCFSRYAQRENLQFLALGAPMRISALFIEMKSELRTTSPAPFPFRSF